MMDLQRAVSEWTREVFVGNNPSSIVDRVLEEAYELKLEFEDDHIDTDRVGSEIADVMHCLIDLAAVLGVDIETATYTKLLVNKRRLWSQFNKHKQRYHIKLTETHPSRGWFKLTGLPTYVVVDPAGWDRDNWEESWNEPITFHEWRSRILASTTNFVGWDQKTWDYLRMVGELVTDKDVQDYRQEIRARS